MRFQIEKDSPVPIHIQIKERIKIGLTFGELKPGDMLPSIRRLETELGVGRAIVHRAYLELQEQGLLQIDHGRRISISESVSPASSNLQLARHVEKVTGEVLKQLADLEVNEISFARYLLSKVLEPERAKYRLLYVDRIRSVAARSGAQIAKVWHIPIYGAFLTELPELLKEHTGRIQNVLTSYYRLDQALEVVQMVNVQHKIRVIPIRTVFSEEMSGRIRAIRKKSKVLLVDDPKDFRRNGRSFRDAYQDAFQGSNLTFVVKPALKGTVRKGLESVEYSLVVASSAVWEQLPDEIRSSRKLIKPSFDFDRASLEEARYKVGILQ